MHMYMLWQMYTYMCKVHVFLHMHILMYIHVYVHVYVYVYVYVYTHVYVHVFAYARGHVHVHMHLHLHVHVQLTRRFHEARVEISSSCSSPTLSIVGATLEPCGLWLQRPDQGSPNMLQATRGHYNVMCSKKHLRLVRSNPPGKPSRPKPMGNYTPKQPKIQRK